MFRITTGTLIGDSPLKMLPKWFLDMYFEIAHNKRINSVMLAKHIGVTLKTAWFMTHRIRNATTAHVEPMMTKAGSGSKLCDHATKAI